MTQGYFPRRLLQLAHLQLALLSGVKTASRYEQHLAEATQQLVQLGSGSWVQCSPGDHHYGRLRGLMPLMLGI